MPYLKYHEPLMYYFWLLGLSFLSATFLFGGLVLLFRNIFLLLRGVRTEGLVTGVSNEMPMFGHQQQKPRVRFVSSNGTVVEFVSGVTANALKLEIGSQVCVIYDEKKPAVNLINHYSELWVKPVVFVTLSVAGLAFAGFELWLNL